MEFRVYAARAAYDGLGRVNAELQTGGGHTPGTERERDSTLGVRPLGFDEQHGLEILGHFTGRHPGDFVNLHGFIEALRGHGFALDASGGGREVVTKDLLERRVADENAARGS